MAAVEPVRRLTRRISWGGMLTALILLFLVGKNLAPTADLAFLALTSLVVAIAVIETDIRTAILVYLAASLLSLAYPGLAAAFPFIVLFGPYPLVRALIDSRLSRRAATLMKLAAGNGLSGLAVILFAWPDLQRLASQYGGWLWPVLIVILQMGLLLFDYVLSLLIQFYILRLRRH